jgi:uncharacterized protein YfaS (alpha-2-macroglobulin family)
MHATTWKPLQFLRPRLLLFFMGLAWLAVAPCSEPWGQSFTATYRSDRLSLSIPYHGARAGSGKLTVEILDPEDQILGRAERTVSTVEGGGAWQVDVKTRESLPLEDLVWERIRYRFQPSGHDAIAFEDTRSVSEILRRPVVHILGQTSYLAGAEAAIRVIVSDAANGEITGNSSIRIELLAPEHSPRTLFAGRLNHRGTAEAQVRFPAELTGNFQLHYVAETPLGSAEYTEPVRIEDKASILLTTEKRMYQPGQTVHIRTLALDRADHHAAASRRLTFEILDPRGNKVFKKAADTDEFGIASAEFTLADEVNLGTYQLRALMGDPSAPANTSELAFTVDRYVLPKFKVAVEFPSKNGKPKREYRPGEHVTGTVQANYFFGKPVDNSEIEIKASSMDVTVVKAASATGRTDKDGAYHFDLKLPQYFAGRPRDNGTAPVLIEATVKDASGHAETRGESITVSESALLVTAIPEGGTLIPGLENQVFLLASYPDGTPAMAQMHVSMAGAPDQNVSTDKRGVAVIRATPGASGESLRIDADDQHGNRASSTLSLQPRAGTDQILLRPDRAVYKAGDRMLFRVFSNGQQGAAYVDIVKDGQTILTRDLDIAKGQAELAVTATPDMSGTLEVNVYRFGKDAQVIGDHRLLFVQPAEGLRVEAIADRPVYKPGEDARIRLRVTNEHGEGVRAALGLEVVDEAVFALSEKQPGFAKAFFLLEQEVMKPRFEIHSFSFTDIVVPTSEEEADAGQRDRAARVLFSATDMVNPNTLNAVFGRDLPQEKAAEYFQRYREAFRQRARELASRLSELYGGLSRKEIPSNLAEALAKREGWGPRDAWGTGFKIEPLGWQNGGGEYYRVQSAGPDRKFDTADDLNAVVDVRTGTVVGRSGRQSVNIRIEHDRGPFNGLAEITGSVIDASGAVVQDAEVRLEQRNRAGSRRATTDAGGMFTLAALPPGSYEIQVSAPGFEAASRRFTLGPRDRAVIASTLWVGSVTESVEVTGAAVKMLAQEALPVNGRAFLAAPAPAQAGARAKAQAIDAGSAGAAPAQETHVRSYFPEALYINPEIITDRDGSASISIPIADSITTWRMAMLGSTSSGALGSASSALKVFQDFFVDLDLPVTLTQGDRVSIPVAIYNYAGERGEVALSLQRDDWFTLVDDSAEKSVTVEPGHAGSSKFTLEAKNIGRFKLTLSARMAGAAQRRDIVVREIEVVPNGREQTLVFNGRLDSSVRHTVSFPGDSIAGASKIFVRLYPGPLSQVIEGMDSILRMPGGCFEQTSSSTYPNVLALDYMKRTKKLSPEVHAKAEGYIANGYQRLLTFEVNGGGFSWFGRAPANKILTAYGLMEFNDMSKVADVDANLIQRTRDWLVSEQQPDGSWKPDTSFINEGATNRYNSDRLRITGYIAWSLANTGYRGASLEKAKEFIDANLGGKLDAYTLAVLANFAVEYHADHAFTQRVIGMLADARVEKDEQVFWNSEETGVYSTGASAAIETTGLAVQALLKWGQSAAVTRKALAYIASKKDASGAWGTTQATIMALRALLMASEEASADARGNVEVTLNGKLVEKLVLTAENNDLFHQFALPGVDSQMDNHLEIRFDGTGGLAYQVAGRYFLPWANKPAEEPLSIDVTYDRTRLAENEIVTATANMRNNTSEAANMVMVDLGIPPGFDLLSEDLEAFKEKTAGSKTGRLEKFSLTATQAILYFNGFGPNSTVRLHFRLRAKYPIRAKTFQSRVYEYYDPTVNSIARPQQLEVSEH